MHDGQEQLEREFHQAMLGIYHAAIRLKPPYRPTRFLQLVNARGGKGAADMLLATGEPSEGFTELYLRGKRLDLSVEYLVLTHRFRPLFTAAQLEVAGERLSRVEFKPPPEPA